MSHSTRHSRPPRHSHTRSGTGLHRSSVRVLALASLAVGLFMVACTTGASAATTNGTATLETPTGGTISYPAPSTTIFEVVLPNAASCTNNTVGDGTKVYTYLVPEGTNLQSLTVSDEAISTGYAFIDAGGPVTNFNVASNNLVPTLPNDLEWGPGLSADGLVATVLGGTGGVWEAGVACVTGAGVLTDNWNVEITFTAKSSDPNGFVWSAVPGAPGTSGGTTSTTLPPTTTTSTTTGTSTSTTSGSSTSTTAGSATTTTAASASPSASASSGTGSTGSGVDPGSTSGFSGATSSTGSGTTGVLAFTGMPAPVTRIAGVGLLAIGFGLMLLSTRRRGRLGHLGSRGG